MLSFEPFRRMLNAVSFISSKLEVISMLFLEQPCCWTAVFTSFGNDILFKIGASSNLMAERKASRTSGNIYRHKQEIRMALPVHLLVMYNGIVEI